RLRPGDGVALRRLAQSDEGRSGAIWLVLELVLAASPADVRHLLCLGAGGNESHAVRPADVGSGTGPGVPDRIFVHALRPVLPWRYANMILLSAMGAVLFLGGWMSPIPYAPFTWVPGLVWFVIKIAFLLFVFSW